MQTSDDLFYLVKSLSPSEKRYFKLFSNMHKQSNNYMELFELLDKMKGYDDVLIKKKLKITSLTPLKNKLNERLMKALRSFYSGSANKSIVLQLTDSLYNLEILLFKRAYNQFKKELKRTKKLALQYEHYTYALKLLSLERDMMLQVKSKHIEKELEKLRIEEDLLLAQVESCVYYRAINDDVFVSLKMKMGEQDDEKRLTFKQLIDAPRLQSEEQAICNKAKRYYNDIKGYYYLKIDDFEKAYQHYKRIVELWEDQEGLIEQDSNNYIKALCNFLNACYYTGRLEEYPPVLEKIKNVPVPKGSNAKRLETVCYQELVYYVSTKQFQKGTEAVPYIEEQLEIIKHDVHLSRLIAIYYNIAALYFYNGDYQYALTWTNKILGLSKTDFRQDVRLFCRILEVIIHYELGNEELSESKIRSTYRFLKSKEALHQLEILVLKRLRLLLTNPYSRKERQAFFQAFKLELFDLKANYSIEKLFGYEDILFWLEQKLDA